jgi:hypothetical protein
MITTMEQYLEKVNNTNTGHTRRLKAHDEQGNKKYWKEVCKALGKNMKELDMDINDIRSYSEYIENHKEI